MSGELHMVETAHHNTDEEDVLLAYLEKSFSWRSVDDVWWGVDVHIQRRRA